MKKLILLACFAIAANCAFGQKKTKTNDTVNNAPVLSTTAFRVSFDKVFQRNSDGSFSALKTVQVNGDIIGSGLKFTRGTRFGGMDVATYEGHDLLIDTVKNVVYLRDVVK